MDRDPITALKLVRTKNLWFEKWNFILKNKITKNKNFCKLESCNPVKIKYKNFN